MKRDEKTEKPSQRRRQEARRKGESPRSTELPQAVSLVMIVLLLPMVVPRLTRVLMQGWARSLALMTEPDARSAAKILSSSLAGAAGALAPLLLMIVAANVTAQVALVAGRPNAHRLKPQFKALNPAGGIKRLFSRQILWELVKTTLKLGAVALVVLLAWGSMTTAFVDGPEALGGTVKLVGDATTSLIGRIALIAAIVGLADGIIARRRFETNLRMTKQEAKEDFRQAEGDPVIRGEVRRRMQRMSRLRMMAEVARADVVVTNPTHIAVALRYQDTDPAPIVVAKGAGHIAQRIREEAAKHGVPTQENKPIARALHASVEIGQPIPVDLYRAVAEILAVVFRAKRRRIA